MSSKINKSIVGFYFQGKLLPGIFCLEKVEKDQVGVIFANWRMKLICILGLNVLLPGGFG